MREGEAVAAHNTGRYKGAAVYWTGASRSEKTVGEGRILMHNQIRQAQEAGLEWFETGEAFPNLRNGKLKGLNDFKRSFGGSLYPVYKGRITVDRRLSALAAGIRSPANTALKRIMVSQSDDYKINAVYNREHAESYGLVFDREYSAYLKYELLERYAHSQSVCLDIGIATGLFAIPLAARVGHIHGIDISPDMVAVCRRNLTEEGIQNVTVYEQSATYLDFPDATFDLIYAYSTLLFIQDIQTAFQEIARVLKPGGKAILDITNTHNLSRLRWERYYRRRADLQIRYFTLTEIQAIWQRLGLEIRETHPTGFLDQWKYVPGFKYLTFLNRLTHETRRTPDRDYRVSQRFPRLANRWYFVLSKPDAGRR